MALLKTNTGIGTTNPTSALHVIGDGLFTGVVTATSFSGSANGTISAGVATFTDLTATRLSVLGVSTFNGAITGTISTATKLETARTFEITGDVVASPIAFDGTGNVSLAATIQPNSVELGTDTFGDYVESISGTANEIDVTGGTGEGSTPVISFAPNPTIGGNVTIGNDLQVNNNLNVTGNITVGGTAGYILVNEFRVTDADIVLGFTTDISGNDVSNDTTANHGGIAVASTEGNPLITLTNPGVGETLPTTYKKFMWFKAGSYAGLNTDAWLSNYAIGIGSTQFPSGTRLAAGSVQITENDLAVVRNINASGIVTAPTFVGNLTGTATTASNLTRSVIAGDGLTGGGELTADRTLNIGVGTGITVNSDDIQLRNSDNLTNNTITKWDDGNGQLTDSLITDDGSIVNVGSAITFYASSGIISATAYYGSGGNLEDIIKDKIEGITSKFKPYNSGIATLGNEFSTADLQIFDNSTVGLITAVGFGSTAQYYFNDVTAVGLTTDASVNTTGVITAYGFEVAGGGVFTGDGSGLINLAGVAAGVTVTNNDSLIGTVSVLNFGPNIDVSPISAGVVTFSLNGNQNFTGIVTASSLDVNGSVDVNTLNVSGISTLGNLQVSSGIVSATSGVVTYYGNFFGLIFGNADTATALETARDFSVSGDVATSSAVSFDGTGNVDLAVTLSNTFSANTTGIITSSGGFVGNLTGTATTATNLADAANITTGTIDSARLTGSYDIDISGNAVTATYANTAGVSTYADSAGVSTNVIGGIASVTSLNVSGISTLGGVRISSGIITATSGIVTYYGDGSQLQGVTAFYVATQVNTSEAVYPTLASGVGVNSVGISTTKLVFVESTASLGIGTTNPQANLHVVGNALITGVVTATTFSGNATSATYATTAGIATYATTAGIATNATTAGTATTATNIDISATSSGDTTAYVVLVGNNVTGGQQPFIDNGSLTYNASTNVLTAGGGFSGDGSALTSLNASQLTSGTISGDRGVTSGSTSSSFVEYNGTTATSGQFDGGTTTPSGTTRLNYGGYLYATRFYGDGSNLTAINYANSAGVSTNVRGTANRVLYNSGTDTTTTSANLTFDGGILGVGGTVTANRYRITSGNNLFVGNNVGVAVTLGMTVNPIIAFGYNSLRYFEATGSGGGSNTCQPQIAIGYGCMENFEFDTLGNGGRTFGTNIVMGYESGRTLQRLSDDATAQNVIFGYQNVYQNNFGDASNNSVFGVQSGYKLTSSIGNALYGYQSGYEITSGGYNTLLGYQAGYSVQTGQYNVGIGYSAGQARMTGSRNIVIGYNRDVPIAAGNDQLVIGSNTQDWIVGNSSYNVGLGTTNPTSRLHVVGDALITGIVTATDFNSASDAKLKTNIQPIADPIEKITQINGVSFNWIKDNKPSMGVIADELQKVLPELVSDTDPKTVNYNGLIGLLIEVVKEQQTKIESLEERLSRLEL